jgi:hypothetical protein
MLRPYKRFAREVALSFLAIGFIVLRVLGVRTVVLAADQTGTL